MFGLSEQMCLVPLKIDITYKGARFVDSFCWDCGKNNKLTALEFSYQTCADLNLPDGFQWRIAMQIQEQVCSFQLLVKMLEDHGEAILRGYCSRLEMVNLGIRYHTVDYSDSFFLDPENSLNVAPELLAKVTCEDLSLPREMEPVIAHGIRQNVFRMLFSYLESFIGIENLEESKDSLSVSDVHVSVVSPNQALGMLTNLWKRAKPGNFDDQASAPQVKIPNDSVSNSTVWIENLQTK